MRILIVGAAFRHRAAPPPSERRRDGMADRIRNWVESGRFEKQAECFFKKLERPMELFVAFAMGYFAFAVVRIFQG